MTVSGQLLIQDGQGQDTGFNAQPVQIQFQPHASIDDFKLIATVTTDPDGRFHAEITVGESGAWRAYYPGSDDAMVSISPTDDVETTGPTPPAPLTACTGVAGCHLVANSDIDGDKKKDQVGVTITGKANSTNRRIIVRVRTAKGRVLQTTGDKVNWYYTPFHAVAAIDGRVGNEIVVGDATGAHTVFWRVIMYRHGALVTLPPPPKSGGADRPSRWVTDSSYSFEIGWWRNVSANGSVSVTRKTAVRNASGKGHTGQTRVYRWKSTRWVKHSTKEVRYSDRAAYKLGGWHIKGVRAWPREI